MKIIDCEVINMEDTVKNECIVKDYIGETQPLEQEVKDAESD